MKIFLKKHRIAVSIGAFLLIALPLCYWATLFIMNKIQDKVDRIQEKLIDSNLEKLKKEKIPKMEEADAEFEKNKKEEFLLFVIIACFLLLFEILLKNTVFRTIP